MSSKFSARKTETSRTVNVASKAEEGAHEWVTVSDTVIKSQSRPHSVRGSLGQSPQEEEEEHSCQILMDLQQDLKEPS